MKLKRFAFAAAAVALLGAGAAVAQYSTRNYMKQGGAEWDVGGLLDVKAGGRLVVDKAAVTANSGNSYTVTANQAAAVVTTDSLSTAAGASQTITINDSLATSGSEVLVTRNGGTNSAGTPVIKAVPGAGTITLTIQNAHASAAFNGTLVLGVLVV